MRYEFVPALGKDVQVFNCDDPKDRQLLRNKSHLPTYNQVKPRDFSAKPYGTLKCAGPLTEGRPDILVDPQDYDEVVRNANEQKSFPVHHQYATWAPKGEFQWNQDGLGYCWTWGGTACMMDLRAIHAMNTVYLAPVSMGYLVGWRNEGNYLESFIEGAQDRGVCPAVDGNYNSHRNDGSYWRQFEEKRADFRLDRVWEVDTSRGKDFTKRQILSGLSYTMPGYIAYMWWGHALSMNMVIDPRKPKYGIRNSHNEDDIIVLEGDRAIPDEMFFFETLKLSNAA